VGGAQNIHGKAPFSQFSYRSIATDTLFNSLSGCETRFAG
jgi:hypothetical protein